MCHLSRLPWAGIILAILNLKRKVVILHFSGRSIDQSKAQLNKLYFVFEERYLYNGRFVR